MEVRSQFLAEKVNFELKWNFNESLQEHAFIEFLNFG
jgi:hypothetical protein